MGRQERRDDKGAQHARDEQTIRTVRRNLDSFCPKCLVWYPVTSNAHAGH